MGNENTNISGRASRGIILNLVLAATRWVSGLSIVDTLRKEPKLSQGSYQSYVISLTGHLVLGRNIWSVF